MEKSKTKGRRITFRIALRLWAMHKDELTKLNPADDTQMPDDSKSMLLRWMADGVLFPVTFSLLTAEEIKTLRSIFSDNELMSAGVYVSGTHEVTTQVYALSDAHIIARQTASVFAKGHSRIEAHDLSQVRARECATVTAYDDSGIHAYDDVKVQAYDDVRVTAWGSVQVEAHGKSKIFSYEQSEVSAFDFSAVRALRLSQVTLNDNTCTVRTSWVSAPIEQGGAHTKSKIS